MTVELISVGTEILLGNIVNTNAAYLAERCALLGLSCYHQSVVGDNEERLEEELRRALSRSDIVILSGGLGPTKDDLTKEKILPLPCFHTSLFFQILVVKVQCFVNVIGILFLWHTSWHFWG